MAHSRLEKIGTIYTRITGLIKAGAMKLEDRPIWYEVYQAFPPHLPPRFDRPVPNNPIKNIFYLEDEIRAKVHKKMDNALPSVNLSSPRETMCQRVITRCSGLSSGGTDISDQDIELALDEIKHQYTGRHTSELASEFTDTQMESEAETVRSFKLKDIF